MLRVIFTSLSSLLWDLASRGSLIVRASLMLPLAVITTTCR